MRALIIEDETAAARNLCAILHEVAPQIEVIATLESVTESIEWFAANPSPDVVFMDIHLADGDSFRIFDHVEIISPIIFTTAYDEYALKAFEVNSIDYLLKPLNKQDVQRSLDKLCRLSRHEIEDYETRLRKMVDRQTTSTFLVQVRDRLIPLQRDQIAYFYTSNERVSATDFEGHTYPIDKTLEALQAQLPAHEFTRANRQFIVARRAVKELSVWFGSRLSLHLSVATPEKIIISKARVPEFKAWISSAQPLK